MAIKKYCIEGELYSANAIQKELKRILNDTPLEKEVQGKDLTFVLEAFKTATYYEEKTKGEAITKAKLILYSLLTQFNLHPHILQKNME